MTRKDGLALLEMMNSSVNDGHSIVETEATSANEIASKLNDLYFKHLEEENKEQSKNTIVYK